MISTLELFLTVSDKLDVVMLSHRDALVLAHEMTLSSLGLGLGASVLLFFVLALDKDLLEVRDASVDHAFLLIELSFALVCPSRRIGGAGRAGTITAAAAGQSTIHMRRLRLGKAQGRMQLVALRLRGRVATVIISLMGLVSLESLIAPLQPGRLRSFCIERLFCTLLFMDTASQSSVSAVESTPFRRAIFSCYRETGALVVRLNRVTKESVCLVSTIQAFLRRTLNELQVLHLLAQVLSFLLTGIHQTVRSFHVDVKDLLLPIDILTDSFKVMFRLTAS